MARALRISFDGAFHHVTNRGLRRQQVFIDDDDRRDFVRLLGKINERFGCLVNAFCLMDNHFHLILETPDGQLSEAMHLLLGNYVQGFNRRHGFDGPLFKDRFYSKLIESDGYVDRAVTYVHRNPLAAGLVDELDQYKWSSYPIFLGRKHLWPSWLSDRGLRIGGIQSRARLRQTTEGRQPETAIDLDDYGAVIGSDIYADAVQTDPQANRNGSVRRVGRRPSPAVIERVVADFLGVEPAVLRVRTRTPAGTLARMITVGLCQDIGGLPLAAIAERFAYASAESAGVATSRFRRAVASDTKLDACVREIIARIVGAAE